jgi:AmmeMemoRadiSam system protein A
MPSTRLDEAARGDLLAIAAKAVDAGLAGDPRTAPGLGETSAALLVPGASFVTLTIEGALRGCCGTLEARRTLAADVWHNALASAFHDPRFAPLRLAEWRRARLEISVLSPREALEVSCEDDLLAALVPGRDGLVLEWRSQRATFLPKVWEQLPEPRDFVRHLKAKAGWAPGFWAPDVTAWRYRTEVIAGPDPVGITTADG